MQLKNMLPYKMGWAAPSGPHHEVALSSRVRLARNLTDRPFPSRADKKSTASIRKEVFAAAGKSAVLAKGARIELDKIDRLDRLFLVERRLISKLLASTPENRGVIVGEREILSLMVNEEDHLRLQGIDSGLCLKTLFLKIDRLDDELSNELPIAFHAQWGYLTACPTNTGTALRASCLIHLPGLALAGEINKVLDGLHRMGVVARGLYGEGTTVMGDFYQISNASALGPGEPEIIENISKVVERLIKKENEARQALVAGAQKLRLEDLVYRSFGTLANARMITFGETMQHLSYLRMGLALGWNIPTDLKMVNELLVLVQPGHIQMLTGKELEPGDRDFLRATLLRRKFKPA